MSLLRKWPPLPSKLCRYSCCGIVIWTTIHEFGITDLYGKSWLIWFSYLILNYLSLSHDSCLGGIWSETYPITLNKYIIICSCYVGLIRFSFSNFSLKKTITSAVEGPTELSTLNLAAISHELPTLPHWTTSRRFFCICRCCPLYWVGTDRTENPVPVSLFVVA
jgi:hypothetical protein